MQNEWGHMAKVILTDEQVDGCGKIGAQRTANGMKSGGTRVWKRTAAENDILGVIGEVGVRMWCGAPLGPLSVDKAGDGGVDLEWWGMRWSIKYCGMEKPPYLFVGDGYRPGVVDVIVWSGLGRHSDDGTIYNMRPDRKAVMMIGWMPDDVFAQTGTHDGKFKNAHYIPRGEARAIKDLKAYSGQRLQEDLF